MKKITEFSGILLAAAFGIMFAGCSGDEKKPEPAVQGEVKEETVALTLKVDPLPLKAIPHLIPLDKKGSALAAGTPAQGTEVVGWCDASVLKSFDVDGDNVYGTDGYILFSTGSETPVAGLQNQPLTDQGGSRVKLPDYVLTPTFAENPYTRINNGIYPPISVPDGKPVGSGNAAVEVKAPLENIYYGNVLHLKLKRGRYRLGFITDMDGAAGQYSPKWFNLYTSKIGSTRSQEMMPDGTPDMAFFDVTVIEPIRQFTLALIHDKPLVGTITAITFDSAPEQLPEPDSAKNAASKLHTREQALDYFRQHFDSPRITVQQTLPPHPRMLASQADLNRMRALYESGKEPWKTAGDRLLKDAETAVAKEIAPVPQSKNCYDIGMAGSPAGLDCARMALAWHLAGNEAYAEKAIEIIDFWASQNPQPGVVIDYELRGCPGTDLGRGLFQMAYAYDLLWNHPTMTDEIKGRVTSWFDNLKEHMNEGPRWKANNYYGEQYFQNHQVAGVMGMLWTGLLTDDVELIQYALCSDENPRDYRQLLNGMIYVKGQPALELVLGLESPAVMTGEITDRYRHHEAPGKGMPYAMLSLSMMTAISEMAHNQGIDLYSLKGEGGETLLSALEYYGKILETRNLGFYNDYLAGEKYLNSGSPFWAGIFEVANRRYPDNPVITGLLKSADRAQVPDHYFNYNVYPVLTHGIPEMK